MSLGRRWLGGNGKSLCGNGKPSGRFEPPKFNPKPRAKEIIRNQKLCDKRIFFFLMNDFLAQPEATEYLIVPHLVVTPNGRSKLSRTDNKNRLLNKDTINKRIDVANNPHLALPAKAPFKKKMDYIQKFQLHLIIMRIQLLIYILCMVLN